jgi:hypothetical protein
LRSLAEARPGFDYRVRVAERPPAIEGGPPVRVLTGLVAMTPRHKARVPIYGGLTFFDASVKRNAEGFTSWFPCSLNADRNKAYE